MPSSPVFYDGFLVRCTPGPSVWPITLISRVPFEEQCSPKVPLCSFLSPLPRIFLRIPQCPPSRLDHRTSLDRVFFFRLGGLPQMLGCSLSEKFLLLQRPTRFHRAFHLSPFFFFVFSFHPHLCLPEELKFSAHPPVLLAPPGVPLDDFPRGRLWEFGRPPPIDSPLRLLLSRFPPSIVVPCSFLRAPKD